MSDETSERAKKMVVAGFGGLLHPPKEVFEQTKPPETVRYGHAKDWQLHYYQLDEHPARFRDVILDAPLNAPLNVSIHTLYRNEWAVKEWVTTDPPSLDVEAETLTFHGYYRIYLFDVWLTEGEEAARVKAMEAGNE